MVKKMAKGKNTLGHKSAEAKDQPLDRRQQQKTTRLSLLDSPVKKRKRNVTPSQTDCPLLPNVPTVPPPPKRQPEQQKKRCLRSGGPTECPSPASSESNPQQVHSLDEAERKPIIDIVNPGNDIKDNYEETAAFDFDEAEWKPIIDIVNPGNDIQDNYEETAAFDFDDAERKPIIDIVNPGNDIQDNYEETAAFDFDEAERKPIIDIVNPGNDIQDNYEETAAFDFDEAERKPIIDVVNPGNDIQDNYEETAAFDFDEAERKPIIDIVNPGNDIQDNYEETAAFDFDEAERTPIIDVVNPGNDIQDNYEETAAFDFVNIAQSRGNALFPDETLAFQADDIKKNDDQDDTAIGTLRCGRMDPEIVYFDWDRDENVFMGQRETFTGQSGPTFNKEGMSPFEVLQKIWDQEIIDLIVKETNRYAQQIKSAEPEIRMLQSWTDVTSDEIWMFFALVMLQSIFPIPDEREYWYPCLPYFQLGDFNSLMPYERFTMIKKCLHFVDNMTLGHVTDDNINLNKISPIINHLNNKFSSLYLPEQNIVIDESLLMWKGQLSYAQMIAMKAVKAGINSYELCESRTGYLWKMIVYTGKYVDSQTQKEQRSDNEPEGATCHIVYDLVRPLLNKGHTLVMDNLNSPMLSRILKHHKTDTMGTLRLHRQFVPESFTDMDTRVGEVVVSYTHDLALVLWHDSKIVSMISTFYKTRIGGIEIFGYFKYVPQVVLEYNLSMEGLDKKGQMLQAFPMERIHNPIWYKKLFHHLLNVSIYNAFVIYNHGKNQTQRQFRMELVGEIIKKITTRSQTGAVKDEPLPY